MIMLFLGSASRSHDVNSATNRTRVIRRAKPTASFFNFFTPPKPLDLDEDGEVDEEEAADLEESLELDYQIGEDIKERVSLDSNPGLSQILI